MKYSDQQRIEKICAAAGKLLTYLEQANITKEVVLEQEPVRWAVTTPLYNIGEHVYNLSDEFKAAYPGIPWAKISGLRHRLVHDYDNTNWGLICLIIFDVLPEFYQSVATIYKQLGESKSVE